MKKIIIVTGLAFAMALSGCATVTGGTHETISVKTRQAAEDVAGASCMLKNKGGTYQVVTPGKVEVKRSSSDLTIQCEKDGIQTAEQKFSSKTRKGALAGNLLLFGIGGTLIFNSVDRATGANYAYPEEITVSLDPVTTAVPVDAASAVGVSSEMKPEPVVGQRVETSTAN
ncbi:hypothetical protein [Paraburkholderia sp. J12]|uniref:hypothetical protein n=1 Tax=Paraburkholderia sp. J12 TaxID=2805432 RepID=UPI002ABD59B9|nr:hypothetical protein [Paraburkholderia sp. J12]